MSGEAALLHREALDMFRKESFEGAKVLSDADRLRPDCVHVAQRGAAAGTSGRSLDDFLSRVLEKLRVFSSRELCWFHPVRHEHFSVTLQ